MVFTFEKYDFGNRDNEVGILMGYRLDGRVSVPSRGKRFFSIPQHADGLWGPPGLLSDGYRGLFSQG
jgi:hypothetical protein